MKEQIADALNEIDDTLIKEANAARQKRKLPAWKKIAALAAVLALIAAAVVLFTLPGNTNRVIIGGVTREYCNVSIGATEEAIIWPWEYLTITEKYASIVWEETPYRIRSSRIPLGEQSIGELLGTCEAVGFDEYTGKTYYETFTVYEISGIDPQKMVAAEMEGECYVFGRDAYDPPENFGQILDAYSFPDQLILSRYRLYEDGKEQGIYQISDDEAIWNILTQCREAAFIAMEAWNSPDETYISFTATSDTLGVYKRVFCVYESGYVTTNVFDYGYVFFIGEAAAGEILSYARQNGQETEDEPYMNSLAGTVTEIGEDYILVDDSILCKDPEDGMVFRIPAGDVRIRRVLEMQNIQPGYIVMVYFTGDIDTNADNLVAGAYELSPAFLYDGGVSVLE